MHIEISEEDKARKLLDELRKNKNFVENNRYTLQIIDKIESKLMSLGIVYTIAYINMHTLFFETRGNQKSSNLIVVNKGFGKTTFLKSIAKSNPKNVQVLPEKMYESFLSKEKPEYFNNKILIHYDLIQGIFGLDKKQKEQILGFWTSILSDGRYHRQNVPVLDNIHCLCMFGIAKESFLLHRRGMFESTFLDRLSIIIREVCFDEKKDIYEFIDNNTDSNLIDLKLNIRKKVKKINDNREKFSKTLMPYILEFDKFDVMSSTRAQYYIYNLLMSNAYINNRNEINEYDILMYQVFHLLHVEQQDVNKYNAIAQLLTKNPNLSYDEIVRITKLSYRTIARYVRMYKNKTIDYFRNEINEELDKIIQEKNDNVKENKI